MIAVDTNLLVYAHCTDAAFHRPARVALEGLVVRNPLMARSGSEPQSCSEASKSSSTRAPFESKLKSCQVPAPAWRRRS